MQGSSFFNVPSKLLGKSPANIEETEEERRCPNSVIQHLFSLYVVH